jgi:DUF4097 and DUF4098 domain-containing protein YvlB
MRRILLTLLGPALFMAPAARADEWSKTFTISGKPELRVETSDANIQVDTWDQNTIEAKVTTDHDKIGENGIRVTDRQNGDSVELEVRFPHHNFHVEFGMHHVNVLIHMPREGRVALHTGDGSIRLSHFKGDMDLRTGDGSQELDALDGNLRAQTGDGHIRAAGRFDTLDLSSGDGRLEADALPGSTAASAWDLKTGDGNVTLRVPGDFAADVSLHTGDGHITMDMPLTVEGQLDKTDVRGKLNGGSAHTLTIHTGDGSIRLEKLSSSI